MASLYRSSSEIILQRGWNSSSSGMPRVVVVSVLCANVNIGGLVLGARAKRPRRYYELTLLSCVNSLSRDGKIEAGTGLSQLEFRWRVQDRFRGTRNAGTEVPVNSCRYLHVIFKF